MGYQILHNLMRKLSNLLSMIAWLKCMAGKVNSYCNTYSVFAPLEVLSCASEQVLPVTFSLPFAGYIYECIAVKYHHVLGFRIFLVVVLLSP